MFDFSKFKMYKQYLNTIQSILDKYFEAQKEYLCCKKGCSYCCEKGRYPYSRLEFEYLMLGLMELSDDEKSQIFERIDKLKKEYNGEMYRCPFLNNEGCCSVYNYRGLICRTFGLIKPNKEGAIILPFCHTLGLNYSKVFNSQTRTLDMDLVEKCGYKNTPKAYNLSLTTLMDKDLFEDEPIEFGVIKDLYEWL